MTPNPEINTVELTPDHAFFVVATDGVWEFLSSQEVVDIVSAVRAVPAAFVAWRVQCVVTLDHASIVGGSMRASENLLQARTSACVCSARAPHGRALSPACFGTA